MKWPRILLLSPSASKRDVPWRPAMLIVLTFAAGSSLASESTIEVSGRIIGKYSGRFPVCVSAWTKATFLREPAQIICLAANSDFRYRLTIRPGLWAIGAFEDRMGDGILVIGAFGPKEPSGFWRRFRGWHKPRFDEVAWRIDHDVANADITLE